MPYEKVSDRTKWENTFPHLYANFGAEEVESSHEFVREDGEESWNAALGKREGWLV